MCAGFLSYRLKKDPYVHLLDKWMPATEVHAAYLNLEYDYQYGGWMVTFAKKSHQDGDLRVEAGEQRLTNLWVTSHSCDWKCAPLTAFIDWYLRLLAVSDSFLLQSVIQWEDFVITCLQLFMIQLLFRVCTLTCCIYGKCVRMFPAATWRTHQWWF